MILLVLPSIAEDDSNLAKARKGNREAVGFIYQAYFDPVYQFVRLRVGDKQTAEDLTSEVFVKFIKALKNDTSPHTSLRGWIFRVARNIVYDHYGRDPELPIESIDQWLATDQDTNPEVQAMQRLSVERIRRAIRMLAPSQQEILLLRFDQQLNLQETADVMDKNVNAIKALQFRAVNTLRQILTDIEAEDN